MKQFGIDRFEGDIAVLVDAEGHCIRVLRQELPSGATEGDVIVRNDDGYVISSDATSERRRETADLIDALFH